MKGMTCLLGIALAATSAAAQVPVVGICPFEDETGTQMGEYVARLLPVMFLSRAKKGSVPVVIINPGPMADPSDVEWPAEVGRLSGADLVLVGRVRALAEAQGKAPGQASLRGRAIFGIGAARLVLEVTGIQAASGKKLRSLEAAESVKGIWLSEITYFGPYFSYLSFDPPKFANSPLGKAVNRGIDRILAELPAILQGVPAAALRPTAPVSGDCEINIRVLYTEKSRASKVYSIAVNRKEESLAVKDGILTLRVPSGETLLHVTVNDPPFKQALQPAYYANPIVDCSKAERTLALEIGPAGEAVVRWR